MVSKIKPRDRLIKCALDLFHQHGFHATGIDTILAQSKVAKTTLYRHFRSKEELIIAALRKDDEDFRNWLMQTIDKSKLLPIEKLPLLFDVYRQWAEEPNFNGCVFAKASAEFSTLDSPIQALCIEHKRLLVRYMQELVDAANIRESSDLATQLLLLLEGATVMAQMTNDATVFEQAKVTAQKLISL